jgi:hypothetical protein
MSKLDSTFGMCEMENAAVYIVEKAIANSSWNISVNYDQMAEKAGFLQLVYHGWLDPFLTSKVEFSPNQAFIDRITPKYRNQIRNLEKASMGNKFARINARMRGTVKEVEDGSLAST